MSPKRHFPGARDHGNHARNLVETLRGARFKCPRPDNIDNATARAPCYARRQHRKAAGAVCWSRETRSYQRPSLARRGAFGGEGLSVKLTGGTAGNPMDQRIESFLGGRGPGGGAGRPRQVRGDLPAAGAGRRDCPSIELRRRSYYLSDLSVA